MILFMDVFSLFILFAGGLAGGFYGSSVGGGALLTFPLLLLVGMPVHVAIGTQRFAAILLEGVSALKFHREKKLHVRLGMLLSIAGFVGSVVGAFIVLDIDERVLNLVVGIMLVVATVMFLLKDRVRNRTHRSNSTFYVGLLYVSIFLFGIYSSFFAVGSAMFGVIILSLFGFPFFASAALARMIGTFAAIAGTFVFATHGLINYQYGVALGVGFAIGSWWGLHYALKKGEGYMRVILYAVIFLTFVKLTAGFLGF
jgi:uncharacterized membrane protein YfcA